MISRALTVCFAPDRRVNLAPVRPLGTGWRSRARWALGPALLVGLLGSCAPEGARPHLVLVTVAGLPLESLQSNPELAEAGDAFTRFQPRVTAGSGSVEWISAALTGRRDPPSGSSTVERAPTLFERSQARGYETAAVVTDAELGEESDLVAGVLHLLEWEQLLALRPAAPHEEALARAASRIDERVGRRREHGLLLWFHLDLGAMPEAERAGTAHGALVRLAASLGAEPNGVLAVWFLPDAEGEIAPLWLHVPGVAPGPRPAGGSATDLTPTVLARLQLTAADLEGSDLLAEDSR
jgi:hypothetical protein